MTWLKTIKKAIGAALTAGAGAAGIVIADLPWPAIIGAAALAFLGAWFPTNQTNTTP
jgi:hypothetical protein